MVQLIKDYRVISIPLGISSAASHSFYIKEHRDNKNEEILGRVLFIGNVDYGINKTTQDIDQYLHSLFSIFGQIESISVSEFDMQSLETVDIRARFAHVVFTKKSSLKAALRADDSVYQEAARETAAIFGTTIQSSTSDIITWMKQTYTWVDISEAEVQADADEYMQRFEEAEETERRETQKRAKNADEDGFVLVKNKYVM
jgi:hypothetical protein